MGESTKVAQKIETVMTRLTESILSALEKGEIDEVTSSEIAEFLLSNYPKTEEDMQTLFSDIQKQWAIFGMVDLRIEDEVNFSQIDTSKMNELENVRQLLENLKNYHSD